VTFVAVAVVVTVVVVVAVAVSGGVEGNRSCHAKTLHDVVGPQSASRRLNDRQRQHLHHQLLQQHQHHRQHQRAHPFRLLSPLCCENHRLRTHTRAPACVCPRCEHDAAPFQRASTCGARADESVACVPTDTCRQTPPCMLESRCGPCLLGVPVVARLAAGTPTVRPRVWQWLAGFVLHHDNPSGGGVASCDVPAACLLTCLGDATAAFPASSDRRRQPCYRDHGYRERRVRKVVQLPRPQA